MPTKRQVIEQLSKAIDEATAPSAMSKEEAFDLLGDLVDEIKMKKEALGDEIDEPE